MTSASRRARRHAVIGGLAAALLAVGLPAPALAGEPADWDGVDPRGTVCNRTAVTVVSAPVEHDGRRLGLIEVRHSRGCGTAWARLTGDAGLEGGHVGTAEIVRDADGASHGHAAPFGPGTVSWTGMLPTDGGGVRARVTVELSPPGDGIVQVTTRAYRDATV